MCERTGSKSHRHVKGVMGFGILVLFNSSRLFDGNEVDQV